MNEAEMRRRQFIEKQIEGHGRRRRKWGGGGPGRRSGRKGEMRDEGDHQG